ncbi:hypothetical protein NI17_004870 [Thermobifida halotolerans]|uniref:Uncharacterized protein n=1 Tax=Thermobifida halotolerans TaxID=483545 RepID=A0A399G8Z5_9ACTN|nr:hypothetical protein [Thermobifida halotolerans]UOE20556.1 hypothetical protein NI17_004870 [Thermobifida halotolerans]
MLTQVEASATRTTHPFRKTRAIVEHTLCEAKDDTTHLRLLSLLHALAACETALAHEPENLRRRLGELRAAAVDLVGRTWLAANADHPGVRAFDRFDGTALPRRLDETLANLLWARFVRLAA